GYSRSEFLAMTPAHLNAQNRNCLVDGKDVRHELLRTGRQVFEAVHRKKNGEKFPVEISASVLDYQGRQFFLSLVRDITERKQRDAEQEAAARMAAERDKFALVGQVAGKMAHDFNNILGGIMGNAEMSLLDCTQPDVADSLNIILQQTLRGRNLTKNLVAFAKDQEPREVLFSINRTLDLVLNLMKKDLQAVSVERNFQEGMPDLLADPGMIEHALVNLIQNAIHAMSREDHPLLKIKTGFRDNRLMVQIVDNGCGIPQKFHDEIYTPSFTLKGSQDALGVYGPDIKGTGYGMANVKKYIEKHRGRISFVSQEGEGTCFILSFPVVEQGRELSVGDKQRLQNSGIARHCRILLVEDDAVISGVQQRILTQPPFEHSVTLAKTGEIAAQVYNCGEFDLVSLDYMLPGQMNGLDVYRYIRYRDPQVPILFISGNMDFLESMKELSATDPHMDHISKPCENIVYVDALNNLLLTGQAHADLDHWKAGQSGG
ncbi:MAG: ATP-binding protein, partial [Desulfobacterales bacterium]|nr:ATP-binding protein [Desulfobacterales bacterium]